MASATSTLRKLLAFHTSHGKLATVTTFRPVSRFGMLEIDDSDQVLEFHRKAAFGCVDQCRLFRVRARVFDYLRRRSDCILEREPLERLAAEGQLMAYRHEGFFYAMDTYREYQAPERAVEPR